LCKVTNTNLGLPTTSLQVLIYNNRSSQYTLSFSSLNTLASRRQIPYLVIVAQLEVIPASTSMRHRASQVAILIKNDTIGTRALAAIKLGPISHDREFQIGRRHGEGEILVVVFGVRIAVAADGFAVFVVAAARVHGVVDVVLGVAVVAADGTVGLAREDVGGGGKGGGEDGGAEEAEEEEGLRNVSVEIEF
jgi:hypothetical protein